MAAAAKHLTPVSLELGGKNPVYLDDTVDLKVGGVRREGGGGGRGGCGEQDSRYGREEDGKDGERDRSAWRTD